MNKTNSQMDKEKEEEEEEEEEEDLVPEVISFSCLKYGMIKKGLKAILLDKYMRK
jgi:hypothetical protein